MQQPGNMLLACATNPNKERVKVLFDNREISLEPCNFKYLLPISDKRFLPNFKEQVLMSAPVEKVGLSTPSE